MNENKPKSFGPPRMGMRMGGEKPKNLKQSIKKLLISLKEYKKEIIVAVILSIIASILSILGPSRLSKITDEVIKGIVIGINFEVVNKIALFLVIIYIISLLFNYIQGFIMATVTNKFTNKLRTKISNKIDQLPLKYFDEHSYGDVLSRVTNDVDTIGQTMNQSVSSLVGSFTLLIGTAIAMLFTNWIMALTAVLSTAIGFSLLALILSKSQKYFKMQQEELGKINGHIEEMYSGHSIVKVYNGTKEASRKFDEINNKLFTSLRKSQFMSGLMQPIMGFVGNFGYVCVCVVGSILVVNNSITIGTIVSFMIYIRIFSNPLTQIAQALTSIQSMSAANERVFEFIEEKEMLKEKEKTTLLDVTKVKGYIEFDNVKFGYNKDLVIKDFSAKIKPGQKVAIVGPTGAGKTTIVNLLMNFYEIDSGDIKIDNISIKQLSRKNIHDLFIMVLQDTWLFNGTIKENIIYNSEDVKIEQLENICEVVGIDHFIKTLPHNYDTVLTDSETISAGEKQLLTIARGMTKNAPFLILDEATSSVDTRTEELVQKAMDKLTEGRTSFIIAHRLSTIKNADIILVMKDGNIIEQGNHDYLIKQKGFYEKLYNSQFQN